MAEQEKNSKNKLAKVLTHGLTHLGVNAAVAVAIVTYCLNFVSKHQEDMTKMKEKLSALEVRVEKDKIQDDQIEKLEDNMNKLTNNVTKLETQVTKLQGTISAQWNVMRRQQEVVNRVEVLSLSNERIIDKQLGLEPRKLTGTTKEKRPDLLERLKRAWKDESKKKEPKKPAIKRVPDTPQFRKGHEDEYMMQQQQQEQLQK